MLAVDSQTVAAGCEQKCKSTSAGLYAVQPLWATWQVEPWPVNRLGAKKLIGTGDFVVKGTLEKSNEVQNIRNWRSS